MAIVLLAGHPGVPHAGRCRHDCDIRLRDAHGCCPAPATGRAPTPKVKGPCHAARACEAQCHKGKAPACRALGEIYLLGAGVAPDLVAALDALADACRGGDADACTLLGGQYDTSQPDRAATQYEAGCVAGSAESCRRLGRLHLEGRVTGATIKRGAELLGTACDAGGGEACADLAGTLRSGGSPDLVRAAGLDQRACKLGAAEGCEGVAVAYDTGAGLEKDPLKGTAYHVRACDAGRGASCVAAGDRYREGVLLPRDEKKAAQSYQKGCVLDDAVACGQAAELLGQRAPKKVVGLRDKACRLAPKTCDALAAMYFAGAGVPVDMGHARDLFQRSCDAGNAGACERLATFDADACARGARDQCEAARAKAQAASDAARIEAERLRDEANRDAERRRDEASHRQRLQECQDTCDRARDTCVNGNQIFFACAAGVTICVDQAKKDPTEDFEGWRQEIDRCEQVLLQGCIERQRAVCDRDASACTGRCR